MNQTPHHPPEALLPQSIRLELREMNGTPYRINFTPPKMKPMRGESEPRFITPSVSDSLKKWGVLRVESQTVH